jgi:hypothetical protein
VDFVGHKRIKEFHIDGMIEDDSEIPRVRERYESILVDLMRSNGYVPHLDVEPAFSLKYKNDKYTFLLTIYGVFIGKAKAKCYLAVSGNNLIPMDFTQQDRYNRP